MVQTKIDPKMIDGVTADATELNILDGATLTTTELNYVDGVTSSIQSQIDGLSGGGITWSTPVDSSITVDTDSTYDIGTATVCHSNMYSDNLHSDVIFAKGGFVTYMLLNSTSAQISVNSVEQIKFQSTGILINGSNSTSIDFTVNDYLGIPLIFADVSERKVSIKNTILKSVETAGESLVAGDLCYLSTDGKYWKADASAESTASTDLLLANATISADTTGEFIEYGEYTTTGLTAGSKYYVSETGGAITATAPTTSAAIVRIVGTALSTTVLKFKPDTTYVELS